VFAQPVVADIVYIKPQPVAGAAWGSVRSKT
jgi:hypothetical protein